MAKKKPSNHHAKSFGSKQADPFVIDMGFTPEFSGWIPPEDRTAAAQKEHERFIFDTPTVSEVFGGSNAAADRPRIWQLVKLAAEKGWIPAEFLRNGHLK